MATDGRTSSRSRADGRENGNILLFIRQQHYLTTENGLALLTVIVIGCAWFAVDRARLRRIERRAREKKRKLLGVPVTPATSTSRSRSTSTSTGLGNVQSSEWPPHYNDLDATASHHLSASSPHSIAIPSMPLHDILYTLTPTFMRKRRKSGTAATPPSAPLPLSQVSADSPRDSSLLPSTIPSRDTSMGPSASTSASLATQRTGAGTLQPAKSDEGQGGQGQNNASKDAKYNGPSVSSKSRSSSKQQKRKNGPGQAAPANVPAVASTPSSAVAVKKETKEIGVQVTPPLECSPESSLSPRHYIARGRQQLGALLPEPLSDRPSLSRSSSFSSSFSLDSAPPMSDLSCAPSFGSANGNESLYDTSHLLSIGERPPSSASRSGRDKASRKARASVRREASRASIPGLAQTVVPTATALRLDAVNSHSDGIRRNAEVYERTREATVTTLQQRRDNAVRQSTDQVQPDGSSLDLAKRTPLRLDKAAIDSKQSSSATTSQRMQPNTSVTGRSTRMSVSTDGTTSSVATDSLESRAKASSSSPATSLVHSPSSVSAGLDYPSSLASYSSGIATVLPSALVAQSLSSASSTCSSSKHSLGITSAMSAHSHGGNALTASTTPNSFCCSPVAATAELPRSTMQSMRALGSTMKPRAIRPENVNLFTLLPDMGDSLQEDSPEVSQDAVEQFKPLVAVNEDEERYLGEDGELLFPSLFAPKASLEAARPPTKQDSIDTAPKPTTSPLLAYDAEQTQPDIYLPTPPDSHRKTSAKPVISDDQRSAALQVSADTVQMSPSQEAVFRQQQHFMAMYSQQLQAQAMLHPQQQQALLLQHQWSQSQGKGAGMLYPNIQPVILQGSASSSSSSASVAASSRPVSPQIQSAKVALDPAVHDVHESAVRVESKKETSGLTEPANTKQQRQHGHHISRQIMQQQQYMAAMAATAATQQQQAYFHALAIASQPGNVYIPTMAAGPSRPHLHANSLASPLSNDMAAMMQLSPDGRKLQQSPHALLNHASPIPRSPLFINSDLKHVATSPHAASAGLPAQYVSPRATPTWASSDANASSSSGSPLTRRKYSGPPSQYGHLSLTTIANDDSPAQRYGKKDHYREHGRQPARLSRRHSGASFHSNRDEPLTSPKRDTFDTSLAYSESTSHPLHGSPRRRTMSGRNRDGHAGGSDQRQSVALLTRIKADQVEVEDPARLRADAELIASIGTVDLSALSQDELRERTLQVEEALLRRAKELEIARWRIECHDVDKRSSAIEVSL